MERNQFGNPVCKSIRLNCMPYPNRKFEPRPKPVIGILIIEKHRMKMKTLLLNCLLMIYAFVGHSQVNYSQFGEDSTVYVRSIRWDLQSANIAPSSFGTLNALVKFLGQNKHCKLKITIYQSFDGGYSANYLNRRINSLYEYFKNNGIGLNRIDVDGVNIERLEKPEMTWGSFLLVRFEGL